jgi:hypothetical protein
MRWLLLARYGLFDYGPDVVSPGPPRDEEIASPSNPRYWYCDGRASIWTDFPGCGLQCALGTDARLG